MHGGPCFLMRRLTRRLHMFIATLIKRTTGQSERTARRRRIRGRSSCQQQRKASRTPVIVSISGLLAVALLSAACSSPSGAAGQKSSGPPIKGGTATFAEAQGSIPNYIFPLYSAAYWEPYNTAQLQQLLYPPLYWFGQGGTTSLNSQLSLADPPVYSDNDTTVTITLKSGYRWSDGEPVTARDVEFWINLLRANKLDYGPYSPGTWPDNLKSASYPNAHTIILHLTQSFSPGWFTSMELSDITPLPQQAWDKISNSSPVSNYDLTAAGAKKVYAFLAAQAQNTQTYTTNPLWKTIDGPWRLQGYTRTGELTFVPNPQYSGSDEPRISKLIEEPFTSQISENNELFTGQLDYGYISPTDFAEIPRLKSLGYRIVPWSLWETAFLNLNYSNPATAPFANQQYIRAAMQELINQPEIASKIFHGFATPNYSPVPTVPRTAFADSSQYTNPYPYSPQKAIASLRAHGWKVVPNGASVCLDGSRCGPGIKTGAKLAFTAVYPSGIPTDQEEMSVIQSSMSSAGIQLSLTGLAPSEVGSLLSECKPGAPCKWGMLLYAQGGYYFDPGPYPDGSDPFGLGIIPFEGAASYQSTIDRYIEQVRTASSATQSAALARYEDYAQKLDPDLWIPTVFYQVSAIKDTLQGTTPQDPLAGNMTPQLWYFTGS